MNILNRIGSLIEVNWRDLKPLQPDDIKVSTNIEYLKSSLIKYGFALPFAVWEDDGQYYTLDGHTRQKVLKELISDGVAVPDKLKAFEVKTNDRKEAIKILVEVYNQKHNKFAEDVFTEWLEVENVEVEDINFESINIEEVLESKIKDENEDEFKTCDNSDYVLGDIIEFNNHRLLIGDSCNVDHVVRLMGDQKADMVFTDPPYDLTDSYTSLIIDSAKQNCHIFIMDGDKQTARRAQLFEDYFRRIFVCDFRVPRMIASNRPMQRTTLIAEFLKGKVRFNNLRDGFSTLIESSVDHKPFEGTSFNQAKKVELPETFILHYSKPNDLVCDFFCGAGSTLIAAEKNNRRCYLMEFNPINATITINRWKEYMDSHDKLYEIKVNGEKQTPK